MLRHYCIILAVLLFSACARYPVGRITTPQGQVSIWLYDETPAHKANFIRMANDGYWDTLTFNRVIPDFVAQAGCPDTPEGFTDTAMLMPPEFPAGITHTYGAVGMGRDDNPQMNSARCQFYIVQNKSGLPRLDGKYTILGRVISGMEVIDSIVHQPRDKDDAPLSPIPMKVDIKKVTKAWLKRHGV